MFRTACTAAFIVALAACRSTEPFTVPTTNPYPPPHIVPESATVFVLTVAEAFGIDQRPVACRTFDVQATDAARRHVLDIHVDAEKLGLRAGKHVLALDTPNPDATVVVLEHGGSLHGETFCTDAMTPNQPPVVETWTAVGGNLEFSLTRDPGVDNDNVLDLELVLVTLENTRGDTHYVRARFDDLAVGWLPG